MTDLERLTEALGAMDVGMKGPGAVVWRAARAYADLLANEGEPDYEAAAKVLADNDGIEVIEWHEDLSRRVVHAAIGDRLLINPPTEEER